MTTTLTRAPRLCESIVSVAVTGWVKVKVRHSEWADDEDVIDQAQDMVKALKTVDAREIDVDYSDRAAHTVERLSGGER